MAVLSTVYFSSRMYYMLGQHGIDVTQDIHRDILHLQVQFLTAMLALNFILLILILMVYRYWNFRPSPALLDSLPAIMAAGCSCTPVSAARSPTPDQPAGFWTVIWIISSTSTTNTAILSVMRSSSSSPSICRTPFVSAALSAVSAVTSLP